MIAANTVVPNATMAGVVWRNLPWPLVTCSGYPRLPVRIGLKSMTWHEGSISWHAERPRKLEWRIFSGPASNGDPRRIREDYHAQRKLTDPEMKAFNIEVSNRLFTAYNPVQLLRTKVNFDSFSTLHSPMHITGRSRRSNPVSYTMTAKKRHGVATLPYIRGSHQALRIDR